MSEDHTIKQGEHLSGIARRYGFADFQSIWDHPANAALKQKRKNPQVLFPGDTVHVPDLERREETRATDAKHRFKLKAKPLRLRLMLEDLYENPIANANCAVVIDSSSRQVKTSGAGLIDQVIPADAHNGRLTILDSQTPIDGVEVPIRIGHLDPVEEPSGQIARLNNLGYLAGDPAAPCQNMLFRSAVEEFQCEHSLSVDGVCGPRTQSALKEVHGC